MSETEITQTKEKRGKRRATVVLSALVMGAVGAGIAIHSEVSADKPPHSTTGTESPQGTPSPEASAVNPEQLAKDYQKETLDFANAVMDKLPESISVTNLGTNGHPTYEISVDTAPPNGPPKHIWATIDTPMPDGRVTSATLRVNAEEVGSSGDVVNKVLITFKLSKDSTYLTQDSMGTNSKDFKIAVQEVKPQDISSVLVFSEDLPSQVYLDLKSQSPKFTDGETEAALAEPPTAEEIRVVMEKVIQ